ncbi:MAG: class I SAM-dependent methyltransferase [Acidimicrobiia bacterium]|nr:class I SAM-dependent methyltransferase [Acidimicrobiia bacterium]
MNRDEILSIYDPWYAETYEERFLGGDPWRHTLYAYEVDVIKELLPPGGRWLDVGCGTGKHLSALPDVEREGLDLSPAMLETARAANPGVPIHEGSYLDEHPEWEGRWDLVTNLFNSYGFVESLREVDAVMGNLASWVAPGGSLFVPLVDAEDLARGTILPWEDPETPVFGGSLYITSVTWTWEEPNGRVHHDQVAPQVQRMVNIFARDFEVVEVRRWPAVAPGFGRPKGVIGRSKRPQRISAEEVGSTYPYEETLPPPDHPLERDPARAGDGSAAPAAPSASALPDVMGEVAAVRSDISQLAAALLPQSDDGYDTLGVVHEQVWAIRKDLADFYHAWDAAKEPPPLDRLSTRALARELAGRVNPFSSRSRLRRRRSAS